MILIRAWEGIAAHWHTRRQEWTMGTAAFAMGAALAIQPDMFSRGDHYQAIDSMGDEWAFAALFFACALFRFVALGINGTFELFQYAPHLRALSSFLGALLWGWFSFTFLVTHLASDTALGPIVAYGTAAMVELGNVRSSSAALGAWFKERR